MSLEGGASENGRVLEFSDFLNTVKVRMKLKLCMKCMCVVNVISVFGCKVTF